MRISCATRPLALQLGCFLQCVGILVDAVGLDRPKLLQWGAGLGGPVGAMDDGRRPFARDPATHCRAGGGELGWM